MKLIVAQVIWVGGIFFWGYPAVASMFIKFDPTEDIRFMLTGIGMLLIAGRVIDNIKRG
jgi:hypothetical protein